MLEIVCLYVHGEEDDHYQSFANARKQFWWQDRPLVNRNRRDKEYQVWPLLTLHYNILYLQCDDKMTSYQPNRPIAGLPQHHGQGPRQAPTAATIAATAPRIPVASPYSPHPGELQAGPRNRLWLALRSGIDSEVDWSLPRLILASFDQLELFRLDMWPDSVNSLLTFPIAWLEEMEKEAALVELRRRKGDTKTSDAGNGGDIREKMVLGIVSEWTRNVELETRAINSLLVLRNASFTSNNARTISKPNFVDFLIRLFSLPAEFLLDLSLRQPEILQHVFVLVQATFPYLAPPPHQSKSNGDATTQTTISTTSLPERKLLAALSRTMTTIIIETRDAGVLHNLLPILISAFQLPNIPLPPPDLIPYLLKTLTLGNPPPLLDLSIDLLISLTQNSTNSRSILADPLISAHLRNMVLLLEHSERKTSAAWEAPGQYHGMVVPNPASSSGMVEQASKRRKVEREAAQKIIESGNPMGVVVDVGDRPPSMTASAKNKLFAMKEPARSINWYVLLLHQSPSHLLRLRNKGQDTDTLLRMHENFVYCSNSTILQVTFWHAYRDFFSALPSTDQMLSASEVIKNVTVAFPCASAKVVQEPSGNKFVISGLGWRKASGESSDSATCPLANVWGGVVDADPLAR